MEEEGGKKEKAYDLNERIKPGHPDWLHNSQSSAQKENAGPRLSKSIKNFKTATAEHKLSVGPLTKSRALCDGTGHRPAKLFLQAIGGKAPSFSIK